jgi:hypothetical protein
LLTIDISIGRGEPIFGEGDGITRTLLKDIENANSATFPLSVSPA